MFSGGEGVLAIMTYFCTTKRVGTHMILLSSL